MLTNLLVDDWGDPLPWSGEGVTAVHDHACVGGRAVPILRIREESGYGWHRVCFLDLCLDGPQTHAVAVRPAGRNNVFLQSVGGGFTAFFDLRTCTSTRSRHDGTAFSFIQDVGDGWVVCAIGLLTPVSVSDFRIGVSRSDLGSWEQFEGRSEMGFDIAEPTSAPTLGFSHPLCGIDFARSDEDRAALSGINLRAERILSAWRGRIVERKRACALAKPSPKLVVVGGSNVLFGVRASILEEDLSLPAANFGLIAGLGLKRILQLAREVLTRGDAVVLAIELFFFMKHWQLPAAMGSDAGLPLSEHGDYLLNVTGNITETMRQQVYATPAMGPNDTLEWDGAGDAVAAVRDFGVWSHEHAVRVFCAWPIMYAPSIEPALAMLEQLTALYRSLEFIIVGAPADTMYPLDWFYNTNHHLHADAAIEHSHRLAGLLRDHFQSVT